jgi:hypothetical protein
METITERTALAIFDLTPEERVSNGAYWLDENFPGWADRINVEDLSLSSAENCICGQLFRDQDVGEDYNLSGFEFAHKTLFSEANSWIEAFVGPKVPVGWRQGDPVPELTPEQRTRADLAGAFLGFITLTDTHLDVGDQISYSDLQTAWMEVLVLRKRPVEV